MAEVSADLRTLAAELESPEERSDLRHRVS